MLRRVTTRVALYLAASVALVAGVIALSASPAFAAGGGYGPTTSPSTAPSGFTTTVASQTVPTTGGTVKASYNGQQLSLALPAGDFTAPVQVTVTAPSTPPSGAVTAFAVSFSVNGKVVSGTLAKPVTFVINNASVKAGQIVEIWNGTTWAKYTNATVTNGSATITLTSDPTFAVATATSPSTVPAATTGTTGVPVDGIVLGAGVLLLIGVGGIVLLRRRRVSAKA